MPPAGIPFTGAELVEAAMKATGTVGQPRELGKRLHMDPYNAQQRITRWLKGENDPDFEGTLLLLEAAGWLHVDAATNRPTRAEDAVEAKQLLQEVRRALVDLAQRISPAEETQRRSAHG
jgi:hypothetical protein